MDNVKRKLSSKLLLSALLAFIFSALLFLLLQAATHEVVHAYCERPDVVARHTRNKALSLQRYVEKQRLSLSETHRLEDWNGRHDLTEILIYQGDSLLYHSHAALPGLSFKKSSLGNDSAPQSEYPLTFSDGTATVYINDLFEHRYTDYATYLDLLIFFVCFITIMLVLIKRKVSYISTLEQEIRILKGGDLDYTITVKGNDELASLAGEIDEMRKAFVIREQYADHVKEASNELMTGISHDLRTPLTALLGYLDVLEGEALLPGQAPFLKKCKDRALQMKSLINELFEYFFVSAESGEQLKLHVCTVKDAFDEVLQEHMGLLMQNGFKVDNRICLPEAAIQADSRMIQRIFDNLFSNIRRYGDTACPVYLESSIKAHEFTIACKNSASDSRQALSHTGIGLKNCERMMLLHQGRFSSRNEGTLFVAELTFPLM